MGNGSKIQSKPKNPKLKKQFIEAEDDVSMTSKLDHEVKTAASCTKQLSKRGRMAKKAKQLEEMLHSPTNNFGLAALFKNFVLINEEYQLEQVSWRRSPFERDTLAHSLFSLPLVCHLATRVRRETRE